MALPLSNTFTWDMTILDIFRKASQRAGGGRLNGEEMRDALVSLNLLSRDIFNRDIPLADICPWSELLAVGGQDYDLDAAVVDIHHAVVKPPGNNQADLGMTRISLAEFNSIPVKNSSGRPTQYTIERRTDNVRLRVWPIPDLSYIMTMYVFVKPDDVKRYDEKVRFPSRYLPAIISGLALEIALDRQAPRERIEILAADYEQKLEKAQNEDRERTSFLITPELQTRV